MLFFQALGFDALAVTVSWLGNLRLQYCNSQYNTVQVKQYLKWFVRFSRPVTLVNICTLNKCLYVMYGVEFSIVEGCSQHDT